MARCSRRRSGEALAARVGLPQDHARWGDLLQKARVALLIVATIWFVLQRWSADRTLGAARRGIRPLAQTIAAVLSITMALGVLALTVVVGHSGATAVWEGRVVAAQSVAAQSVAAPSVGASPPTEPVVKSGTPASGLHAASTPSVSSGTFTMTEVQQHTRAADCWWAMNGNVYDLTTWVTRHPGGPDVIEAVCGKDSSVAFQNQHEGEGKPNQLLAGLRIGSLGL